MNTFLEQLRQETRGLTLQQLSPYLQRRAKHLLRAGDWERANTCDQLARQARTLRKDVLQELASPADYD